jgi:hypothetical protein
MKVDRKIIDRFQHLIDFEAELMKTQKQGGGQNMYNPPYNFVDYEMANQWGINCLHLLRRVFGEDSDHYSRFNEKFPDFPNGRNYYTIKQVLGILKAAKDDFESGYLFETRTLIQAEVFDDLLEQAEHLHSNGYLQPAAVIAGAALEDGLRKLCQRRGISLPAKTTIDPMNVALAKDGAYNSLVQKRITMLADLRNKAAHGKFSEFSEDDVNNMLSQVRSFMENHFS